MRSNEFYSQLSQVSNTYNWSVTNGNAIVGEGVRGKARGVTFNPITAVAYRKGHGTFGSNKRETLKAGKALGLSNTCLLYTSPSPRDRSLSRMPSSA